MLKRNIFFLLIFVTCLRAFAQTVTSSPYSHFGFGEYNQKIFSQAAALGGTHIALYNEHSTPKFINPAQPASYLSTTRYIAKNNFVNKQTVFDVGVNNTFSQYSTTDSKSLKNDPTFNYITLAFPMGKNAGAALGVMPMSNVGYKITDSYEQDNIGDVKEVYEGDGGINQIFLGLSWAPFPLAERKLIDKNAKSKFTDYRKKIFVKRFLSSITVGGNLNYNFGTINTSSRMIYPSQTFYYNTALINQTVVRGLSGDFGLLMQVTADSIMSSYKDTVQGSATFGQKIKYRRNIKENIQFSLGYTYSHNSNLQTKYSDFAYTFLYKANGINEFLRDTIHYSLNQPYALTLPAMHGIGFSIRKGSRFNILADYEMQLWSGFKYLPTSSPLQDMKRVSLGFEYIPDKYASTKADRHKRIQYRFGAHYSDGNLLINNSRVNEYGVSLGAAFPIGYGRPNIFSVSLDAGQMGTTANHLVQQQYIKVKLGFTFNEIWFWKNKYD